jgi:hypothetical protein
VTDQQKLTDERIAALARKHLSRMKRPFYARWKDGIDIDYPVLEVEQFARAIEAELSARQEQPRKQRAPTTIDQWVADGKTIEFAALLLNDLLINVKMNEEGGIDSEIGQAIIKARNGLLGLLVRQDVPQCFTSNSTEKKQDN